MQAIKTRLPDRRETLLIYTITAFPIFAWAILQSLRELPSWLMRLSVWDLISVASYIQAFALAESIVIFAALIAALTLVPFALVREKRVLFALFAVAFMSATAVLINYGDDTLRQWGWSGVAAVSAGVLLLMVGSFFLVARSRRLVAVVRGAVDRLAFLSLIYVTLGVGGLLVVVIRNLWT